MNYCLVENGKVTNGPRSLPKSWRNVSGLDLSSDAELKELGWLPWKEILPEYDEFTHYRDGYNHEIGEDEVIYTSIVVAFTTEQLVQNKWNDWTSNMIFSDDMMAGNIPRQMEDIITMLVGKYPDILNEAGNEIIKKHYNDKKALRATKPTNPNE